MAHPTINPLYPIPDMNDEPQTFTEDIDRFIGGLPTYRVELNALADYLDTLSDAIDANADQCAAAESSALAAQSAAESAADAALVSAGVTMYAAGTTYTAPATVIGSDGIAYRRIGPSAAGDDPVTSVTGHWVKALGSASISDGTAAGRAMFTASGTAAQQSLLGVTRLLLNETGGGITYDANGRVATDTETLSDGTSRVTTYTYAGDGSIASFVVAENGVSRRTTYVYSGGNIATWATVQI